MINNPMDDEDGVFAIRRNTQDKLTYKNIIASCISRCNSSKGTLHFKDDVEALESTINFNVSGYNLRKEMDIIRDQVKEQRIVYKHDLINSLGKKALYHAEQAKLKIKIYEWYWNNYYTAILQILANHNLLMDTERRISVIQDNRKHDEDL